MFERSAGVLAAALLLGGCGSDGGEPEPVPATELLRDYESFSDLLVGDGTLHFQGWSGIHTLPLAGGDRVELAHVTGSDLAQDESSLWLTTRLTGRQVVRIDKSDGTQQIVADQQWDPGEVAVDDTHVFWVDRSTHPQGEIWTKPKDGGESVVLAYGLFGAEEIAIDAQHVYFTSIVSGDDYLDSSKTIWRVARDGSESEPVVTGQLWPRSLIVSADALYWFDDAVGSMKGATNPIMRHDLTTGETRVLYEDALRPYELVLAGDELYWTGSVHEDCQTEVDDPTGVVRTMPASGGAVRTLASKRHLARHLAVSDDTIYFTQSPLCRGAIYALPRH